MGLGTTGNISFAIASTTTRQHGIRRRQHDSGQPPTASHHHSACTKAAAPSRHLRHRQPSYDTDNHDYDNNYNHTDYDDDNITHRDGNQCPVGGAYTRAPLHPSKSTFLF